MNLLFFCKINLIILSLNNKISMLQKDEATKIKWQIPSFNTFSSFRGNHFYATIFHRPYQIFDSLIIYFG